MCVCDSCGFWYIYVFHSLCCCCSAYLRRERLLLPCWVNVFYPIRMNAIEQSEKTTKFDKIQLHQTHRVHIVCWLLNAFLLWRDTLPNQRSARVPLFFATSYFLSPSSLALPSFRSAGESETIADRCSNQITISNNMFCSIIGWLENCWWCCWEVVSLTIESSVLTSWIAVLYGNITCGHDILYAYTYGMCLHFYRSLYMSCFWLNS